ncbi:MAG: hypothetical protein AB1Z98_05815 [Nannocystaceae bacterium]
MRTRRHTTSQHQRALMRPLGRPVQLPPRREVLDDALLGADWRWDSDHPPTLIPS